MILPCLRLMAALALTVLAAPALAQAPTLPPALPPRPIIPATVVSLTASFANDQRPIRSGLVWRLYEDRGDGSVPSLLTKTTQATPSISLQPGTYIIHASFGFASASKRILVGASNVVERVSISAGALRLGGAINEQPIPKARLSFSVFVPIGTNSEGRLVVAKARAGDLIRLPEGTYHVVSTYGESNAIMRADLKVEAGQVTDATLNHRAATLTLKLVAAQGSEAFAGTAFSVLTPGGDVIREAIGAYPTVTLAEGDYVLIARHEGQIFTREFKVVSGLDQDIEITAAR